MAKEENQNQEAPKEKVTKERVVEKDDKSSSLITLIIGIVVILLVGWLILTVVDTADNAAPEPTPETETTPEPTNEGGDADVNVEEEATPDEGTTDEEPTQ